MKYSIIVPAYNVEKYIEKCLESIFKSTYSNYEVIIINDGSTDNTKKIISQYVEKYKNIIYIEQENKGLSEARNEGVKRATGDYILFIDSDDYIDNNLLEVINSNITEDIDVLRYQLNSVYEDVITPYNETGFDVVDGITAFRKITMYKYIEVAPLYVIQKKYYCNNKFSFKKGVYHEDYGLIPLVICTAKKVKSIDFLGYNYVQRDDSIMSNNDIEKMQKKMDDMLLQFNNAINYLKNIENSDYVKSFYANSIIDKYNSLDKSLKKKNLKIIKKLKIVDYLNEDTIKHKLKKLIYKLKYEVI